MGEQTPFDFTADMNLNVYNAHIASFNKIESNHNSSYHNMMADIYQLSM